MEEKQGGGGGCQKHHCQSTGQMPTDWNADRSRQLSIVVSVSKR